MDKFGGAHVLVANAGFVRPSAFEKLSEKDWDELLAIHLRSTYKVRRIEERWMRMQWTHRGSHDLETG